MQHLSSFAHHTPQHHHQQPPQHHQHAQSFFNPDPTHHTPQQPQPQQQSNLNSGPTGGGGGGGGQHGGDDDPSGSGLGSNKSGNKVGRSRLPVPRLSPKFFSYPTYDPFPPTYAYALQPNHDQRPQRPRHQQPQPPTPGDRDKAICKACGWSCDRPKAFRMREHIFKDCPNSTEADKEKMRQLQNAREAATAAAKEANAMAQTAADGGGGGMGAGSGGGAGGGGGVGDSVKKSNKKRKKLLGEDGDGLKPYMPGRSPITCHVLDSTSGKPGAEMGIRFDKLTASGFVQITQSITDADGRCSTLLAPTYRLEVGIYKMSFFTNEYFNKRGISSFYPFVEVTFEVKDPTEHYHIPLLLSPYSYTTYRGS